MKLSYKLYALHTTQENLKVAEQERFYRVTPGYILVYRRSRRKLLTGAKEIAKSNIRILSDADRAWLNECNLTVLKDYARAHQQKILKDSNAFLDSIERELQVEREKLNKGSERSDEQRAEPAGVSGTI